MAGKPATLRIDVVAEASKASKVLEGLGVSLGLTLGNMAAAGAKALGEFAVDAVKTAGRVQELTIALHAVGKANGYTTASLDAAVKATKGMGIETATATGLVTNLARANLDVSKAANLARVAQDAAVLSGKNSSETLETLTAAIQTGNTQLLRSAGLTTTASEAYAAFAKETGKAASKLSSTEKQQAILNAVLREGAQIQGVYEAAMGSGSKQIRSFERIVTELKEEVGGALLPVFDSAVTVAYSLAKTFGAMFAEGGALRGVLDTLATLAGQLGDALGDAFAEGGALSGVLSTVATVAGQLGRVFASSLLPLLADLFRQVAGTAGQLAAALRPALAAVMAAVRDVLPPVLALVSSLVSALMPSVQVIAGFLGSSLVPAFARLVTALAPLLSVVATLVGSLVKALAPALEGILRLLVPVADVILRVVVVAVEKLAQVAAWVVDKLRPLLDVLGKLSSLVGKVGGALGSLGRGFALPAAGPSYGAGFAMPALAYAAPRGRDVSTSSTVINMSGVVDPVSTARALRRLLALDDARMGRRP